MMFARRLLSTPLRRISLGTITTFGLSYAYLSTQTDLQRPLPPTDPIWSYPSYKKLNPHANEVNDDKVIKEIPLENIRPELLEKEGELTLALCRAIWSSPLGFDLLRTLWRLRYHSPDTSHQLWTRPQLATSTYPVGTILTNQFIVLSHTPDSILVRFGDVPNVPSDVNANSSASLDSTLRPLDGLFEIKTTIDKERGVARLELTTLVWKGDEKSSGKAVPVPADAVHWWAARLWLTLASGKVQK